MTQTANHIILLAAATAAFAASPAEARKKITPYIELDQTVSAQLSGGTNDVLTYSTIAAGVDAELSGPRAQLQMSYRYERNIAWGKNIRDQDSHTGLVRGNVEVVPGLVNFEGGAIATRGRQDFRGSAPGYFNANSDNVTQVYSAYAGPTISTHAGPIALSSAYRIGYTKAEARDRTPLAPGQPVLDQFDDSVSHLATVSAGMEPGILPFGWTVSGAYEQENAGQLKQRFESKGVRGDVIVPVSPTIALVGGVGYEDIAISQRSATLDATGNPVLDGRGRFVTDPASVRQIAFETDGIYWDAGVSWRPSSRTDLEVRVGRRYGSMSYTGAFSYQMTQNTAFSVVGYDTVTTFGQQLNDNVSRLPTSFRTAQNGFNSQHSGCTFGRGGKNAGGCLNGALGAINTAAFRVRGVTAMMSSQRGPWSTGVGVGYEQRKYLAPASGSGFSVNGLADETWFAEANLGRQLTPNSSFDASFYGTLYDSGIPGAGNVVTTGAQGTYSHSFGRLSANASAGIYQFDPQAAAAEVNAIAQVGVRYSF
jgi:hypothetical protein